MMLSLSEPLDLDDLARADFIEEPCSDALRLLYASCVFVAISRSSGRRRAIEAAMMPVPGSAVAQIVALIAFATTS